MDWLACYVMSAIGRKQTLGALGRSPSANVCSRPKADDVSCASAILSSRPSKGWFYLHWPLFSSQQPLKPPEGGFGCLRLPSCLAGQLCRKHLYLLDGRRLGE